MHVRNDEQYIDIQQPDSSRSQGQHGGTQNKLGTTGSKIGKAGDGFQEAGKVPFLWERNIPRLQVVSLLWRITVCTGDC